jgi:hypothetical protein
MTLSTLSTPSTPQADLSVHLPLYRRWTTDNWTDEQNPTTSFF